MFCTDLVSRRPHRRALAILAVLPPLASNFKYISDSLVTQNVISCFQKIFTETETERAADSETSIFSSVVVRQLNSTPGTVTSTSFSQSCIEKYGHWLAHSKTHPSNQPYTSKYGVFVYKINYLQLRTPPTLLPRHTSTTYRYTY